PAKPVSSLVLISPQFGSSTFNVTFGCFALESAFTPSTTLGGALPVMSQTVKVPDSLPGVFDVPPQAATTTAIAIPMAPTRYFLGFICVNSPYLDECGVCAPRLWSPFLSLFA